MNKRTKELRFLCWGLVAAVLFFLVSNILIINKVLAKGEAYQDLKTFSEVLSLVQSHYVEEVKPEELVRGAIVGMLRTLDPHSAFMPPEMYKEMQVETEGSFGGIGIEITMKDDHLTVVSPIEETPAQQAGIKAGDRIMKVNGEPTKGMSLIDAVHKMRGPSGSKVTITIMREGFTEPKDFAITRAIIKIKSVKWQMKKDNIGYIRITNFNKTTDSELEKALKELKEKKLKGFILDLRNNPGGLLDQAVTVTDFFLEKGELIAVIGHNGAGKSTLLKMLASWLLPDSGEVLVDGINLKNRLAIVRKVGFVPETPNLFDFFSVGYNLKIFARLFQVPFMRMEEIMKEFNLLPYRNNKIHVLSKGLRQRVSIGRALLADPPVLLFDEPTSGIDFDMTKEIYRLLKDFHASGKTIIFTSHRPEEIKTLATRIIVLHQGSLIFDGSPQTYFQSDLHEKLYL